MSEINAANAAERLRQNESGDACYPFDGGVMEMEDTRTLAEAYLAEHPADDELEITDDWLRSVGFVDIDEHGSGMLLQVTDEGPEVSIGYRGQWLVGGDELSEAAQPKTRGQLRLLSKALGITLNEP